MGTLSLKQTLNELIRSGFHFETAQDKLLIKGDLAALSETQKQFLREHKTAIIQLIENQTAKALPIRPMDGNAPRLLSYSQQGLWLLDKINNGSQQYNITSAFRLAGKVDEAALQQTFRTILERHESLRSSFSVNAAGQPVQSVQSAESFQIQQETLDPAQGDLEKQVVDRYKTEAGRVFDLTKDLLLSVQLLRLEDELHYLIINMHHIASDGWSMGLLVREFTELYNSYVQGHGNPLPDLPIQYADYAQWQRQWLKGAVLQAYIDYWKKQLAGLPLLHNLPLDKPRPRVQRFEGRSLRSTIGQDLMAQLQQLCRAEQTSLFMGVHAAFSALLARYSNETDIVVGSPVANREQAETANLVGFFMNLIVLRADLSGEPGFRTLLQQSKQTLEGAYEYQQMPFDRLVEELKVNRSLSHSPLFQVLLTLHNESDGELRLENLRLEPLRGAEDQNAKYDLSLDVYQKADRLELVWEYNTDLFETATIENMARHFEVLLAAMLGTPEVNVFNLDLIDAEQQAGQRSMLKGEEVPVLVEDHVVYTFQAQCLQRPTATALICNDRSYTFEALGSLVDRIAQALLTKGVQENDRVGLCLLRDVELVASIFACFRIGAAYVPLDPVYPPARLAQIITDADPKCVISLDVLQKTALKASPEVQVLLLDDLEVLKADRALPSITNLEHSAYVIFTSGTTGRPKGIELSHRNLANLLKGFDRSFGAEERQKWLAQTSVNFDISVLELIWTLSRGHQIVLQASDPTKLLGPDHLQEQQHLDFSVMFFGADKSTDHKYDLLLDTVKFADENGLTAIWTPERHFGEFGGAFPSPAVMSSALAALTKRIQVRSGSVVLPLHDPVRVAEEWSIIDNLSNGRIGLSIASGWHPNDFVFYDADYQNRHQIMRDKIAELKQLWKGEPLVRKNGVGQDFEIKIRPTPKQKDLPIWVTAAGNPQTFEYAGEIGANILTHMLGQSLEQLAENIRTYHAALEANGFRKEDTTVTLMLHTYIEADEESAFRNSERAFKEYLESSIKLIEPMAKAEGLDIHTQRDEIIEIAYHRFSRENTLIGSPESCQYTLQKVLSVGVSEIACLVDFGVEHDKVLAGLEKIAETRNLFRTYRDLYRRLEVDRQENVMELIRRHELSHVQMTPSQSKMIWNMAQINEGAGLDTIRHWFIGGEAVPQELIQQLRKMTPARFYNMYGPTETTVWSAWREITPEDVRIGGPIINTELLLLNAQEREVPLGVVGELYIGGEGLAKGYFGKPDLTAERFRTIGKTTSGSKRYYRTGDLLRLNAEGTFEFIGRADNQVKVNGYRIELEEIEHVLNRMPGVQNSKVVPVTEEEQASLRAYVAKAQIVRGEYTPLPEAQAAKAFNFPDGSRIYSQSDRQIGLLYQEVMEEGIYFKHGIDLREGALVLDVGANIGGFSIDLNQRHPDATVIAFEPIPQTFSALKKNFEHRKIKGLVYNYGVSNKREQATFHYYPEMSGMSGRFADKETIIGAVEQYMKYEKQTMAGNGLGLAEVERKAVETYYQNIDDQAGMPEEMKQYLSNLYTSEEVDCRLLPLSEVIDDLGIQAIDLLKVDVEKSERLVLEGIRPEQWPMIRQLVVEVDGDDNLRFIEHLLTEKGYALQVDELAMSDAEVANEENTYLLFARHPQFGRQQNNGAVQQIGVQVNEAQIREELRRQLPEYMVPRQIAFVEEIPLMENGKVDLMKLKSMKTDQAVLQKEKSSLTPMELAVYQLWCEVLKKENIPYHISIFEAGGSSIEMVLLHEKMRKQFDVDFSLIELFRKPTLEQQAQFIQSLTARQEVKEDLTADKALEKGAMRRNVRRKNREHNQ